jgi:capsular exopolysaccharide synthesis family protein
VTTATLPSEKGTPIIPGLAMTDNSAYGNYFEMTKERDQWRRDREAIGAALKGPPSNVVTALEPIESVRTNSELNTALKEALASDAKLRALLSDYTEEFRPVRQEKARLDSLQQVIIPSIARQLIANLERREDQQSTIIASAERELRQIPTRSIQEGKLERAADIDDKLYRNLEERHANAKLAEVTTVPDMEVVDWPKEAVRPVEDPRPMTLLMALGGALGLGILLAILRDRMDPRLRYPDQVTGGMGLNILGAVPALRRGRLGASDMALAVEAFRAIQLSLLHTNGNQSPVTVTFTSPGASDGKSFVTSNLAIAFADMGHRTLVIDGDVRRGTLHQLMGTTHKPGLTDFLAGHGTRADVIQHTRYPLLDMIGCGSRGEAGPKLLGSPAMAELVESLKPLYDVILIDSPPLGACVDPMILGTLTRNMVMVLRTGTTDRTMAESKLDILDRLPVRVLGAILNDVSASGPYRYYSYMTGYEVVEELPPGAPVEDAAADEPDEAERFQGA